MVIITLLLSEDNKELKTEKNLTKTDCIVHLGLSIQAVPMLADVSCTTIPYLLLCLDFEGVTISSRGSTLP